MKESIEPLAGQTGPATGYYRYPVVKRAVWTWEVPVYFWLGGIAGGAFVVGSAADLFGGPAERLTVRRAFAVAMAAALPCTPLLIKDLGRPDRFHHMLRIFKPSSPMNLGAWTLSAFSPLVVARAMATIPERLPSPLRLLTRLLPRPLMDLIGSLLGVVLAGYSGVLLGSTNVPLWAKSKLLGGLFMASAASSGTAAVSVVSALRGAPDSSLHKLERIGTIAELVELGLLGGFVSQSGRTADPLARRMSFWVGGAGLGTLAPLALRRLTRGRHGRIGRAGVIAGAAATVAGAFFLRWSIVEAGKASANDQAASFEFSQAPPSP